MCCHFVGEVDGVVGGECDVGFSGGVSYGKGFASTALFAGLAGDFGELVKV